MTRANVSELSGIPNQLGTYEQEKAAVTDPVLGKSSFASLLRQWVK